MGVRAGRRFLLRPTRPRLVRPSSRYFAPAQAYGVGEFAFGGVTPSAAIQAASFESDPIRIGLDTVAQFTFTPTPQDRNEQLAYRTDLSVTIAMPQPAIIHGKPILPEQGWANMTPTFRTIVAASVATKPLPPVPKIVTRPDTPPASSGGSGGYVWKASDLGSGNVTTWPEEGNGPNFNSIAPYRPSVASKSVLTSKGRYTLYDKMVIFDYKNVEHMWVSMPTTITGAFTWLICGIILSYPSARYGHYLLDHGSNPGSNGVNYGFTKKVGGEGDHRSALLYQKRTGLLGTTYPTIEVGPYARVKHDYTPQPRMFYGIFNNNKGTIGVRGRNYFHQSTGTILDKNHKNFVVGRRNGYTSTDLASHMGIFEIRFFPDKLSKSAIYKQYQHFYRKYDFAKYKI